LFQKFRELSKNLAVYGVGDVAIQIVSFLLVPVYVRYLSPADYGILGLLGGVEAASKLFFRWGLDGSFMRFWYDCEDQPARQRLASTIFFFLLAINACLLGASLLAAPFASPRMLGATGYTLALQLVLLNTFAIGFTFIPFHVLRIEQRTRDFSVLTFARSVATLLLRITLVVGLHFGIWGVVVADVVVTAGVILWMVPLFAPLIRPVFSPQVLRESLAFGLPRLPHALAQQVMAIGDRFILNGFGTLADIGVYSMSVSFGLIPKLFLSAFENAWAPFYYATAREADGPRTFAGVTTYVFAVLALLTAGLAAIADDLLSLVVGPAYAAGGGVVAWTAIGVLLQGVYLLTSIGLNITKRTEFYPLATGLAAATSIGANLALVPGYGGTGAAIANALSYAVLATASGVFAHRVFPVDYEWARMARAGAAGLCGYAVAVLTIPVTWPAIPALAARGLLAAAVYGGLLAMTGFLTMGERERLQQIWQAARRPRRALARPAEVETEVSETTDLAGTVVSATAGEAIDPDEPDGADRA